MFNYHATTSDQDRDHVKTRLQYFTGVLVQGLFGSSDNLPLFAGADGFSGRTECRAAPGLDLDENQGPSLTCDQADLADGSVHIALKDLHP